MAKNEWDVADEKPDDWSVVGQAAPTPARLAIPTVGAAKILPQKQETGFIDRAYNVINNLVGRGSVMDNLPANMQPGVYDPVATEKLVDRLQNPESIATALPAAPRSVGVAEKGVRGGVAQLAKGGLGMARAAAEVLPVAKLANDAVSAVTGVDLPEMYGAAAQRADKFASNPLQKTQIAGFTPNSIVQDLPSAGASAISSTIGTLPALLAGPGAAYPLMFAQTAGQEYGDGRNQGLTPVVSALRAAPMGAAEVIGEKLGGFDKVSGGLRRTIDEGSLVPLARGMVESGLRETPGEFATALMQSATDKLPGIGLKQNMTASDLGKDLKDTLETTLLQSALMVGGGHGLHTASKAIDSSPKRQIAAAINDAVQNSDYAVPAQAVARDLLDPVNAQAQAQPKAASMPEWAVVNEAPITKKTAPMVQQEQPSAMQAEAQQPAIAEQKQVEQPAKQAQVPESTINGKQASWVIRNKETGDVVMETFDRKKVEALNTEKYEAVPIQDHLAGLNQTIKAQTTNETTQQVQPAVLGNDTGALRAAPVGTDLATTQAQVTPKSQTVEGLPDAMVDTTAKSAVNELPAPAKMDGEKAMQIEQASEGLRPGDIVHASGKPFSTQAKAQEVKKQAGPGWVIKKGAGGFVVRYQPATEKQIANGQRQARNAARINTDTDSMFAAIAKLGGININQLTKQWGFDPAEFRSLRVGIKPVARATGGMTLDQAGERLAELGYLSRDEHGKHDLGELFDLFDGELRGNKHYTPQGFANVHAAMQEQEWMNQQLSDELDKQPQEAQNLIEDFIDEYENVDPDEEARIEREAIIAESERGMEPEAGRFQPDARPEEIGNRTAGENAQQAPASADANQRAGNAGQGTERVQSSDEQLAAAEAKAKAERQAIQRRYEQDADQFARDRDLKRVQDELHAARIANVPFSRSGNDAKVEGQEEQSNGQRPNDSADRSGLSAYENLHTVGGGASRLGWAAATRVRRTNGEPAAVYRGAETFLSGDDFQKSALGFATGHPSSGLGVWFTSSKVEAGQYGDVEKFHLDIRKPKVFKVDQLPQFDSLDDAHRFREDLRKQGYDGIAIDARGLGGSLNFVAFNADQVVLPNDGIQVDDASLSRKANASGLTVEAVQRHIAADTFNHEVDVYQSLAEAPAYIRNQAEREGATDVEGYFDPRTNRVALIADNLASLERAREVARHELIGHYGIENMVGHAEMGRLANRVIKAEQDGNKAIADVAKQVDATQPGLDAQRRAKEIIAVMAERNVQNSIVKRVLDAIRTFLKSKGFLKSDITDAEIAGLLRDAQSYLREQGREMHAGDAAPAFSRESSSFARAYHGTPHRFDKFSTQHIGAGEGNQAFGWGLYFAGKKDIAEYYREKLTTGEQYVNGELLNTEKPEHFLAMALDQSGGNVEDARDFLESMARPGGAKSVRESASNAVKLLDGGSRPAIEFKKPTGQLYEVNIPDDHEYLLWDKPLSEQPQQVKEALDRFVEEFGEMYPTVRDSMQSFERNSTTGSGLYRAFVQDSGTPERASRDLHSIGIAGIKYLDNTSRDGNGDSHNYVVFDDSRVNIEKTYYSRSGNPQSAFAVSEPSTLDNIRRAMQDNKIDLKRVQQAITEAGGKITEQQDAYLNEELYIGKVSAMLDKLAERRVTPLLEAINKAGLTLDEVNQYLYARHAPEANARLQKINEGEKNKALSGMSDERAADIMRAFSREGKADKLANIAKIVDTITKETRQRIVANGLETADMVAKWEAAYKHYVPLMTDDDIAIGMKNSGFTVRGRESQRRLGQTSEARNILANVIAQAQSSIKRAEKAKVGRSLLDLARAHPNKDFWTVDKPVRKREINPETGLMEWVIDKNFKEADNVLVVKENGEDHYIVFNKRNERAMRVAAAMKNLDAAKTFFWAEAIGKVNRHLAMWITSRNPLFWVTNFARDVQHAAFNLSDTPISGKEREMLGNIPQAIAGFRNMLRGDGSSKWAGYAKEFKAAGAETGFVKVFETADDHMADLEKELKHMQQGNADPRKLARAMVDMIDDYNSVIENGVRLAVYQTGRENGMTIRQAASMAKNITVNFNRRGNHSTFFNALYMFMNANIQGHARMFQALGKSRKAQVLAGSMIGMGFMLDIIARSMGGDDDETKRKKYDEIPDFEKEKNWIFMSPDGSGKYVKIPMPQGLNVLPNMGRMMSEMLFSSKKQNVIEKSLSMGRILIDSFNPFGSSGSFGQLITPSIAKPIVQVWDNKSFTGAPVYKEQDPRGYKAPAYTKHFKATGDQWVEASKLLNDVTGGDAIKPGMVNVPPEVLRTLFLSYVTPGITQTVDKSITTSIKAGKGEKIEPSQVPGLSRFYGEAPEERARERAFYEEQDRIKQAIEQIKQYNKAGDRDAVERGFKELGDGDARKGRKIKAEYDAAQRGLRELNAGQRKLESDKRPDGEQQQQLDGIKERRKAMMQRLLAISAREE